MPEGPEVTFTADQLKEALKDKYILDVWIGPQARHKLVDAIELPCRVNDVVSYGKRIIFVLQSNGKEYRMVSFLGMSGCWSFTRPKNHLHFEFKIGTYNGPFVYHSLSLYYSDHRHFGKITVLLNQQEFNSYFENTGPDLLVQGDQITPEIWREKLTHKRLQDKEICWFLMKPKYFSGIGNYLKSEILYRSRISPQRKLKDLSDYEIELLRITALNTIRESYASKGLTISDYKAPNGEKGTFTCQVYGQAVDAYGYHVQKGTFTDKRASHFVPEIQK